MIQYWSEHHQKGILIYGRERSNKVVIVHLSGLEGILHTNHFILFGHANEITLVGNVLDGFLRGQRYFEPVENTIRVDFKTGHRRYADKMHEM